MHRPQSPLGVAEPLESTGGANHLLCAGLAARSQVPADVEGLRVLRRGRDEVAAARAAHNRAADRVGHSGEAAHRGGRRLQQCYRVRGELLASDPASRSEAADCFQRALSIARQQGSAVLEGRAADSLARHVR